MEIVDHLQNAAEQITGYHHPGHLEDGVTGVSDHLRAGLHHLLAAGGWTRDGAVQEQIDDSVADAVTSARSRMPVGPGEIHCVECGEAIPEARRKALPGVTTCVACQDAFDRRPVPGGGINRRGNKDSQLK